MQITAGRQPFRKGGLTGELMRKLLLCSHGGGMLPGRLRQSVVCQQRRNAALRPHLVRQGKQLSLRLNVVGHCRRKLRCRGSAVTGRFRLRHRGMEAAPLAAKIISDS